MECLRPIIAQRCFRFPYNFDAMGRFLFCGLFVVASLLVNGQDFDFTTLVGKTHTERTNALFDYYGIEITKKDSVAVFEDMIF